MIEKSMRVKAEEHSLNSFLNSFLKEWKAFEVVKESTESFVLISIKDTRFKVPVVSDSLVGKFHVAGEIQKLAKDKVDRLRPVDFIADLIGLLDPGHTEGSKAFYSRFLQSVSSMEEVLVDSLSVQKSTVGAFIENEQTFLLGHPFHPTPKSRAPLNAEEAQKYAPEFKQDFALKWYLASPEILHQHSAEKFDKNDWSSELIEDKALLHNNSFYKKGYKLFPVHPWQEVQLKKHHYFKHYLDQKLLVPIGESHKSWKATSSLRSVYSETSPYMLKFSLSLKLTNSIRHLLPKEVDRGLQLYDVVHTDKIKPFFKEFPQFNIICEPSYLCLKDLSGHLTPESVVICRENPFKGDLAKNKCVLSKLTQDSPFGSRSVLLEFLEQQYGDNKLVIEKWFNEYLNNVLEPFLILQSNYGVLLGAHQQNLILTLDNNMPTGCYFRDCQGTGYSHLGYKLYSSEVLNIKEENENVVSSEMGHALFGYYLIANSTFGVISALSVNHPDLEKKLILNMRKKLNDLKKQGVKDPGFLNYLLESSEIKFKGNFFCTFKDINENTTINPLSIYTMINNPIHTSVEEIVL